VKSDAVLIGAPQSTLPAARIATALTFFVSGFVFANWVTRIPEVQQHLELSSAALGVALAGTAAGSLLGMPASGWLIARFGSRSVTRVTSIAACLLLTIPTLAPGFLFLAAALLVYGLAYGAMDVAMNAQATEVERGYGRPLMSTFHGVWSAGGIAGALLGGAVASMGIAPSQHLAFVAVGCGVVVVAIGPWLLPATVAAAERRPTFALPTGPLLGLGTLAFCGMLSEGVIGDWSAVYLRGTLGTDPGLAATGYAIFSLAMTLGRFSGDRLSERWGAAKLIRFGGAVSAAGLCLSVVVGQPAAALVGFACVGAGLSIVVPIVFSAAGRVPGKAAGPSLAAVATVGYAGFLVGSPLIGFAAELVTLRGALGIVAALCATIAVMARAVEDCATNRC